MNKSYCLVCTKMKPKNKVSILQFNEGICNACVDTPEGKESLGIE